MQWIRPYITQLSPQIRSIYDRLFFNVLEMRRHATSDATNAFERFTPGISWFASEPKDPSEKPSYHRGASCGPKSMLLEEYERTRRCSSSQSPNTRNANKARIFKCYMERLIYDKIYERYNLILPGGLEYQGAQDDGHEKRLVTTHHDFVTCFPTTKLLVDVTFDERDIPFCLVVRVIEDDGDDVLNETTETYVKSMGLTFAAYGPLVQCRREVKSSNQESPNVVYKIQTFGTGFMPWDSGNASETSFDAAMRQWVVPYTSIQQHHMFGGGDGNPMTLRLRTRMETQDSLCTLQ